MYFFFFFYGYLTEDIVTNLTTLQNRLWQIVSSSIELSRLTLPPQIKMNISITGPFFKQLASCSNILKSILVRKLYFPSTVCVAARVSLGADDRADFSVHAAVARADIQYVLQTEVWLQFEPCGLNRSTPHNWNGEVCTLAMYHFCITGISTVYISKEQEDKS